MKNKKILITGGAGFIGFHLTDSLMTAGFDHISLLDNLNDYYSVQLKEDRLAELRRRHGNKFTFIKADLTDTKTIDDLFKANNFDIVVNLAAQAGVRYAKENPRVYVESNIDGFFNIIDAARKNNAEIVVYASSSSVYGGNTNLPFSESDMCANPLSIYASSKLSNEMMAESYVNTFGMRAIGLRFFNVYGPWGRPDAVYYKWSDALATGGTIELRENGEMYRDMTYVRDVTESIERLITRAYEEDQPARLHEVYNIGNENPVRTGDLLAYLIEQFGVSPTDDAIIATPKGKEEPVMTRASTDKLKQYLGYAPHTPYRQGISEFVKWYKQYHHTSD